MSDDGGSISDAVRVLRELIERTRRMEQAVSEMLDGTKQRKNG